jgi:hypothetical protein
MTWPRSNTANYSSDRALVHTEFLSDLLLRVSLAQQDQDALLSGWTPLKKAIPFLLGHGDLAWRRLSSCHIPGLAGSRPLEGALAVYILLLELVASSHRHEHLVSRYLGEEGRQGFGAVKRFLGLIRKEGRPYILLKIEGIELGTELLVQSPSHNSEDVIAVLRDQQFRGVLRPGADALHQGSELLGVLRHTVRVPVNSLQLHLIGRRL